MNEFCRKQKYEITNQIEIRGIKGKKNETNTKTSIAKLPNSTRWHNG